MHSILHTQTLSISYEQLWGFNPIIYPTNATMSSWNHSQVKQASKQCIKASTNSMQAPMLKPTHTSINLQAHTHNERELQSMNEQ